MNSKWPIINVYLRIHRYNDMMKYVDSVNIADVINIDSISSAKRTAPGYFFFLVWFGLENSIDQYFFDNILNKNFFFLKYNLEKNIP